MPQQESATNARPLYSRIGAWLGPVLAILIYILPAPQGLSDAGWACAAVAVLMAVWWATEAIPVAATALIPLVLFPLLGVIPISQAASAYGNSLIFLFMGGFMLALTIQKTGLHKRLALNIIARVGDRPGAIVAGFMVATALLSMGVSNTATTLMMLPIAASIAVILVPEGAPPHVANFATVLMMGIANSAVVGGMGTLIGTPPNALLAAFMAREAQTQISFVTWLAVGIPAVLLMLPAVWLVLNRIAFPYRLPENSGAGQVVAGQLAALGPMKRSEKRIAVLFIIVAVAWVTRPLLNQLPGFGGLNDTTIAIMGGLAVFLLPHGEQKGPLMRWDDMKELPWGILLLFGGGLSLAAAVDGSGLAAWMGGYLALLADYPPIILIGMTVVVIIFLTELTSNTGTTATFLPIIGAIAIGSGLPAAELAVPATLAASCAFMLPVATPPNAIVYASGYVTVPQMVKSGLYSNLFGIVLLTLLSRYYLPLLGL